MSGKSAGGVAVAALAALGVALWRLSLSSITAAAVYGVMAAVGAGLAIRLCGWPRSRRLSVLRREDPTLAGLAILALLAFPQPWLIRDPAFAALFWSPVIVISVLMARSRCSACRNCACPFHRREENGRSHCENSDDATM